VYKNNPYITEAFKNKITHNCLSFQGRTSESAPKLASMLWDTPDGRTWSLKTALMKPPLSFRVMGNEILYKDRKYVCRMPCSFCGHGITPTTLSQEACFCLKWSSSTITVLHASVYISSKAKDYCLLNLHPVKRCKNPNIPRTLKISVSSIAEKMKQNKPEMKTLWVGSADMLNRHKYIQGLFRQD
jgi:hypothetical protein